MVYLTILGWLRDLRMAIYLRAELGIPLCFFLSLIFLMATILFLALSMAEATNPKAPSPNFSKN